VKAAILRRVLVTDRTLAPGVSLRAAVERAIDAAGITAVVLRELDLPTEEQAALARELVASLPVPVLMARNAALAREAGCAGVQLGWDSPSPVEARDVLGRGPVVGASVHSVEEGLRVAELGVDYLLFGPVFPTPKRHGLVFPVGLEAVQRLAGMTKVPIVAVGGMDLSREADARAAGAAGIAAIRAFMAAGT
jgi:thiamine-phosphate pyrophosphorylase